MNGVEMKCERCKEIDKYPYAQPIHAHLGGGALCLRCHRDWYDYRTDLDEAIDYEHCHAERNMKMHRGSLDEAATVRCLQAEKRLRYAFYEWVGNGADERPVEKALKEATSALEVIERAEYRNGEPMHYEGMKSVAMNALFAVGS